MHHIHRRTVCPHGWEGPSCHPGSHRAVGHADCTDTPCPSATMEPHGYNPHKSGIDCKCGFRPREKMHI